ncbi:MAG: hypothetical protein H7Y37_06750 [Anaerolineae bacterium]|nr:hypothetical protein [Gloeobacterales cyanobacterium ES-bin-313]
MKALVLAGLTLFWSTAVAAAPTGYLLNPKLQEVHQFDLGTGKSIHRWPLPVANVYHNAVRTREGELLIAGDESLSIIDVNGKATKIPLPIPALAEPPSAETKQGLPVLEKLTVQKRRLFGISYEGRTGMAYLGVRSDDGTVTLYRYAPQKQDLQILTTLKNLPNPRDLQVTADGLRIYISSVAVVPEPAARIYPINPLTGTQGEALNLAFDPTRPQLNLSADGNVLYTLSANNELILVNTRTNTVVRRLPIEVSKKSPIVRVLPALDNRHIWILTQKQLLLWDPFAGKADLNEKVPTAILDLAMTEDKAQLWSLQAGRTPELHHWDSKSEDFPVVGKVKLSTGTNRVLIVEDPQAETQSTALPKVAVIGFETGPARFGKFPNVSDVVGGSLLRTRQYEILSPVQVSSVLQALDFDVAQLQGNPDEIRQVAGLLGADVILAGDPLQVEMPNRGLESLAGILSGYAAFLLPQLSSPKVFANANAFNQAGEAIWKANVNNFDPAFFSGKGDLTLLSNAMVITGEDIANRFSKGAYNTARDQSVKTDLPPLQQDEALKTIKSVALLGPDATFYDQNANAPSRLGQALAPQLIKALNWEVIGPTEAFGKLATLGIEPAQILTTDPKLLARALGVDAVMTGLVRSSTFISSSLFGIGQGASVEVILQYQLVDQEGRILWKDVQVRNISVNPRDTSRALEQAASAIVERLQKGIGAKQS